MILSVFANISQCQNTLWLAKYAHSSVRKIKSWGGQINHYQGHHTHTDTPEPTLPYPHALLHTPPHQPQLTHKKCWPCQPAQRCPGLSLHFLAVPALMRQHWAWRTWWERTAAGGATSHCTVAATWDTLPRKLALGMRMLRATESRKFNDSDNYGINV